MIQKASFPILPPSVNKAYSYNRYTGKKFKNSESESFQLLLRLKYLRGLEHMNGQIGVHIVFTQGYVEIPKPRDIDNMKKLLYDALTQSRIIKDDKYIIFDITEKVYVQGKTLKEVQTKEKTEITLYSGEDLDNLIEKAKKII